MKLSPTRVGLGILAAALVGLAVFGFLASSVTSITDSDQAATFLVFEAVIDSLDSGPPRLQRDGSGKFVNRISPAGKSGAQPSKLGVLLYRSSEDKLVQSDIPFWFFRLKGPAARLALRGSGFDMDRLGITPADIARQGPGLILDEASSNGDRLLVWAE